MGSQYYLFSFFIIQILNLPQPPNPVYLLNFE